MNGFRLGCFLSVIPLITIQVVPANDDTVLPNWIWAIGERHGTETIEFRKEFSLDDEIEKASLRITSDFADLLIKVNGTPAGEVKAYDPPFETNIRQLLSRGRNRITIQARGVAGPSAIAAGVFVEARQGESVSLVTDPSWGENDSINSLGRVHPHRWAPHELPEVSPFAEYNQWKEARPGAKATLSPLPPGFEIELLRAAQEGEDSWVSMVFDGKGRIIIAREQKGLLRFTLPAEGNGKIQVEVINDTLEECRGLLWKEGSLFANANDSKGLYRLRDTNGDDQFDEITLLRHTEGKTGHGRNDLALGPDGKIHAIHGDVVLVPEDSSRKTVAEKGAPKELGHQVSTNSEGKGWLIHNRGLRNPYGIDFNPDGEPFTYDADNEGDVGLPFYRPTRINHLVSGANYGWHQERGNTRNMTVYAPDTVPTTFDVGRGSPTAVKFGTRSNFPQKYRDSLFALDWAYGRIITINLVPRGSSYYGSGEVFLEGRPLNVTDLDFDEIGEMYFITGGRKTQAGLYRIRYTGKPVPGEAPTLQATARNLFSEKARQRRRKLEGYHGNPEPPDFEEAWTSLGDPDPWIRNAARVAMETQALERWRQRALNANSNLHGLTALLALARTDSSVSPIVEKLTTLDSTHWSRNEKLTALRTYEICGNAKPLQSIESIEKQIATWVDSGVPSVRKEVIRILVATKSPVAVPAGMRLASAAEDQLNKLHYLEMLSEASAGWTPELRNAFFRDITHARKFSLGDRFMDGFFKTLEKNALAKIEDENERERFSAMLSEKEPIPPELSPRPFVKNWTLADFSDLEVSDHNPARGRKLYDAALCSRCHVTGTYGRPVGPDLTMVASRFSRKDILEAILDPSRVVAEVHRNVIIEKKDGTSVIGRIIQNDFRKSILHVSLNPYLPGELTEIHKSEIQSYEESPASPMPPGLLNTLTKEEILDLLTWLESGGEK